MARTRRWYAIAGGLGLALAGCGGGPTGPPPGPPSIVLAASSVTFAGVQGRASPGPQTVAIKAGTNGVALSGIAVGSITYTGASGWLSASVDQPRSPATLTVSATTGGLAAGNCIQGFEPDPVLDQLGSHVHQLAPGARKRDQPPTIDIDRRQPSRREGEWIVGAEQHGLGFEEDAGGGFRRVDLAGRAIGVWSMCHESS